MKEMFKKILIAGLLVAGLNSNSQQIEKWDLADLKNAMANSTRPTILNFWATFCKPCLEEIPYFQEALAKDSSVELILVSLDIPEMYEKLPAIAKKYGFTARVVFLEENNADLFCPAVDEKWSGAIPASVFINNQKSYKKFFEEKIPEGKFLEELRALKGM